MNYRHAYHAGNFADVLKHLALVAILSHLKKKEAPFAVIDTHAGRGLYDLTGPEAQRTAEAGTGITRLPASAPDLPVLDTYLSLARSFGPGTYPGSPLITASLLRESDRLIAIEKHPEEQAALTATLKPFRKARATLADGYTRLPALLPPPERRGLVLIDPPFEAPDEFRRLADCVGGALRRFATGTYLIWFPIKSESDAAALGGELLSRGATRLLRLDLDIGEQPEARLHRCGLLVINPPYGFAAQLRQSLQTLAPHLGANATPARWQVETLAGETA